MRRRAEEMAGRLEALQEAMEARALRRGRRPHVETLARIVARLDKLAQGAP